MKKLIHFLLFMMMIPVLFALPVGAETVENIRVKNVSTMSSQMILMPARAESGENGIDVVKITLPASGDLLIRGTNLKNVSSIKLHKASTFKDSGKLITTTTKSIHLSKGVYYLRIVRRESDGRFPAASFRLTTRLRADNEITVPYYLRTSSTSSQTLTLSVEKKGTSALHYVSNNSAVKVDSEGKVTIPANFAGKVLITVSTDRTVLYNAASTTVTVKVRPPKTSITTVRCMTDKSMRIDWTKKSGVTGYQLEYSSSSTFSTGTMTKMISGSSSTTYYASGLKADKNYYIRVRSYIKIDGKTYYSVWSDNKSHYSTMKILMIGNSLTYYNDMPWNLAAKMNAIVITSAESGASLADHLNSAKEPGKTTMDLLSLQKYDYIIIQDASTRSFTKKTQFMSDVKQLCNLAKKKGAQPILYATWAYEKNSDLMNSCAYTYTEMYRLILKSYEEAASVYSAWIAKAGTAFYEAGGGSSLYQKDHKHPSKTGSNLAMNTIISTIRNNERR